MIKTAITPELVKQTIDEVWNQFDTDKNGVLDINESRLFVDHVLKKMYGEGKFKISQFNDWFQ